MSLVHHWSCSALSVFSIRINKMSLWYPIDSSSMSNPCFVVIVTPQELQSWAEMRPQCSQIAYRPAHNDDIDKARSIWIRLSGTSNREVWNYWKSKCVHDTALHLIEGLRYCCLTLASVLTSRLSRDRNTSSSHETSPVICWSTHALDVWPVCWVPSDHGRSGRVEGREFDRT